MPIKAIYFKFTTGNCCKILMLTPRKQWFHFGSAEAVIFMINADRYRCKLTHLGFGLVNFLQDLVVESFPVTVKLLLIQGLYSPRSLSHTLRAHRQDLRFFWTLLACL